MNPRDLDQFIKRGPVADGYPGTRRTLYAPVDDVHGALKLILANCRNSLVLSMYGWTDEELAELVDHLLDDPKVFCQITLDSSQFAGKTESQVLARFKDNLDTNIIGIGRSERGEIIHRKMLVVDGMWTITGSTNWSLNGEQKQDNEATFTWDPFVAAEARQILDLSHAKALTDMKKAAEKIARAGHVAAPPINP